MKILGWISWSAAALLPALTCLPATATEDSGKATVYVNGHVYTDKGWATAFAEAGGLIVAAGSDGEVRAKGGSRPQVVDLQGKTVFPGLVDLHLHPGFGGKFLKPCNVAANATVETIAATVAQCVKKVQPGDWIFGEGWSNDNPEVKKFDRSILDKVAPNNPVVLADISGHDAWVNTPALRAAGFTKTSPEVPGGKIERDAQGEPTGVLREMPAAIVRYTLPPSTDDEATRNLKAALDVLFSKGVTSIQDASIRKHDLKAYLALADSGQLRHRVRGCIAQNLQAPDFDEIFANREAHRRPNFVLDCVKIFMDYTPNESHSAAMLEPYEQLPGSTEAPTTGSLLVKPDTLSANVVEWDKAGLMVMFHCGGDRSVRVALDAVEAARKANGAHGPRHQISHNTFHSPDDLKRAAKLGVALEFSPVFWYPTPLSEGIAKAVGPVRSAHIWPAKSAIDSGNFVIAASDWPGASDPNPWLAIETLVTRKAPGNQGTALGEAEAITLKQAVDLYTKIAAKMTLDPRDTGFISVGARADFIVIDRDPFATPIGEVHKIKVLQTVVDGKTVYKN
ncbi:MAG: amidohydrolase [Azoarcus sp.]|jgi:predicted amidohydrolase YtcJ|nr:amidohydrolase [Azoarcus sp.]